ncbi:MAG: acetolactate synthase small subunit, partial [Candidatus Omnitrophota bacterium]
MQHTVSVLVENHAGVLARVAGLFSARGFNIDSLAVGETQDPEVSRMTVVANGDDRVVEQIMKQLNKLVDVIRVDDLTIKDMIARELVLVKIGANGANRKDLMHVVPTFRAQIVDVSPES